MRQPYYWKWCFILVLILAGGVLLMRAGDPRIENVIQCIGQALSISFVVILGWLIQIFSRRTNLFGSKRANSIFGIVFSVIFISIAGYVFVHSVPQGFLPREEVALNSYTAPVRYLISSFFITMLCYIVFTNIDTANKLQQTLLENEQFKHAHLRAQLISLKQQISPHFLFNSLSTLKTMAAEKETKTFIVELAHVYRYLLNSNAHDVLKLSEELKFITSYLYILHYRFETALNVSISVPDHYHEYLIPPLSLQLLVENAVKHNGLSPDRPLQITVYVNDAGELVVENSVQPKNTAEESTGLGLQNIRDRYKLLFDKTIHIHHSTESFSVSLPLISYEDYHY